ncbi:hypothetical protein AAY473_031142 [Plecturocebus cupreus]
MPPFVGTEERIFLVMKVAATSPDLTFAFQERERMNEAQRAFTQYSVTAVSGKRHLSQGLLSLAHQPELCHVDSWAPAAAPPLTIRIPLAMTLPIALNQGDDIRESHTCTHSVASLSNCRDGNLTLEYHSEMLVRCSGTAMCCVMATSRQRSSGRSNLCEREKEPAIEEERKKVMNESSWTTASPCPGWMSATAAAGFENICRTLKKDQKSKLRRKQQALMHAAYAVQRSGGKESPWAESCKVEQEENLGAPFRMPSSLGPCVSSGSRLITAPSLPASIPLSIQHSLSACQRKKTMFLPSGSSQSWALSRPICWRITMLALTDITGTNSTCVLSVCSGNPKRC